MTNDFSFYVYEHWRPDTGVCFYVGKGKGKRAWTLKHFRNRYHKAIVSKLVSMGLSVDVRIIADRLSSDAAIALEISRIAFYGQDNLANMTAGGEGLRNPSAEVRQKISLAHKKRFEDPEQRRLAAEYQKRQPPASAETRAKLSRTSSGRKHRPETILKMKVAAKKRGISAKTREAQRKACTGRPRVPHTAASKELMRIAAIKREAARKEKRKSKEQLDLFKAA